MSRTNLAESLGYDKNDRLLIVNCDDLGSSHSANIASHRALTDGFATSATLMVPCPWALEAVEMLDGFSIGVHLTLTSEYEGYRWRGLTGAASLHDETGFLARTTAAALSMIKPGVARAECRAQIEAALSWGVDVTHLDAHMMVMQFRLDLYEIYLDLAVEYNLPVRMMGRDHPAVHGFESRQRADERGVLYNDHLIEAWPRQTAEVLRNSLAMINPGVTEIYVHPVVDGRELRAYDQHYHAIRRHDMDCLLDQELKTLISQSNIKFINYKAIRDLQRNNLI